jgi:hypothetical protein
MPSVGTTPVALTAIVLDTNNNALSGQLVTFVVADPVSQPAYIDNVSASGISDTNGQVTASLNLGANKTNRNITVTASAIPAQGQAPIVATVNVAVVGNTITFGGGNQLVFNATLPVTVTLTDSGANPIAGQTITLVSKSGNTVAPATATTSVNGSASFTVTGTVGGSDTLTASGAGTSQSEAITVASTNFLFKSPAAGSLVVINTPQPLVLHWDNAAVPVVGQQILFSSTRGTLSSPTAVTDANGNASVSITSTGAGPSQITAVGPNNTPSATPLNIVFITTSANKVALQASQASVAVNTVGSTANYTTLTAIVRDVNDNLVQGAVVNFQIVTDPSGGSLSAPSAVTNISGSAQVNYIAGSTSSGSNTVVISASVVSVNGVAVTSPINATVDLTVNGQSLFIRMQTDNQIQSGVGIYTKAYYALVTDAAGNPIPNANVVLTLEPTNCIGSVLCGDSVAGGSIDQCTQLGNAACPGAYEKGQWVFCSAIATPFAACPAQTWAKIEVPGVNDYYNCLNEDLNFNGILDPGEDYNHNGKLDPGNIASVVGAAPTVPPIPGATPTDANGIAIANVNYVKGYATWSAVLLTATITVAGTEYIQSSAFILPIAGADVGTSPSPPPPGAVSPFGLLPCVQPD